MPTVSLPIGGRTYDLTCRAGGEDALKRLGALVDEKVRTATASAGQTDEVRRLLFAAILLADELTQARAAPEHAAAATADALDIDAVAGALERLAGRVETLAASLEDIAQAS